MLETFINTNFIEGSQLELLLIEETLSKKNNVIKKHVKFLRVNPCVPVNCIFVTLNLVLCTYFALLLCIILKAVYA